MNATKPLLIFVPIALLEGCAPLMQAPLVYTSSQVVGLSASTTSTETPGFSVTIGVKIVDAAYVPVAVSKEAEGSGSGNLKHYDIQPIFGQFGEELTPEVLSRLSPQQNSDLQAAIKANSNLDEAKKRVDQADAALASARTAVDALKGKGDTLARNFSTAAADFNTRLAAIRSLAEALKRDTTTLPSAVPFDTTSLDSGPFLSAAHTVTNNLTPLVPPEPDPKLKQAVDGLTEAAKSIDKLSFEYKSTKDQMSLREKEIPAATTNRTTVLADFEKARKEFDDAFDKAKDAFAKLANIRKRDALSVYGSFNTKANVDGTEDKKIPTTSLGVGKVFSTGVASQNLTEAEKIRANGATALAVGDCIQKVAEAVEKYKGDDAAKKALFEKMATACRSGTEQDGKKS